MKVALNNKKVRLRIVSYYLSRLDKEAYINLGYRNFKEAYHEIGLLLDVKPSSVRGMRDVFDYFLPNKRVGYRRASNLRGTTLRVFRLLENVHDNELLEVVRDVLRKGNWLHTDTYRVMQGLLKVRNKEDNETNITSRVFTGKKAEEHYVALYKKSPLPVNGNLVDTRDLGCGYDFMIENAHENAYVEVKGVRSEAGEISFTDKEWKTAKKYKGAYYLVIVMKVYEGEPEFKVIRDPASVLSPKKRIYPTISVSWSVKI